MKKLEKSACREELRHYCKYYFWQRRKSWAKPVLNCRILAYPDFFFIMPLIKIMTVRIYPHLIVNEKNMRPFRHIPTPVTDNTFHQMPSGRERIPHTVKQRPLVRIVFGDKLLSV